MKICLTILMFLLICNTVYGQTCDCPKTMYAGTKADTIFHLSNGKTIVLCGWKNPNSNPITFSEFILSVCGQDTIIDFWGAVLTCRLKVNADTLFVEQIEKFPDRKSTRLNSSHVKISYAVFCLKKKADHKI